MAEYYGPKNAHNNFCYILFPLFVRNSLFWVTALCIKRTRTMGKDEQNGKYRPKEKNYIIKYQKQIFFRLVSHKRRISFRIL